MLNDFDLSSPRACISLYLGSDLVYRWKGYCYDGESADEERLVLGSIVTVAYTGTAGDVSVSLKGRWRSRDRVASD